MNTIIASLLLILGSLSLLFAGFMWVGLQVAKVSAGEHADTQSFWVAIVPAVIFGIALLVGAGAMKR